MRRATLVRLTVFVATTVAAWGILAYGTQPDDDVQTLQAGEIALRDYYAVNAAEVVNVEEWTRAQEAARDGVAPVTEQRTGIEEGVLDNIEEFFAMVASTTLRPPPSTTTTSRPEDTTTSTTATTTVAGEEGDDSTTTTTATTVPPEEVQVQGFLFIDANGDGVFDPDLAEDAQPGDMADVPLPMVAVDVESPARAVRAESQSDGTFTTTVTEGEVEVRVDLSDPEFPGFAASTGTLVQTLECFSGSVCQTDPVGFAPDLLTVEEVVNAISTPIGDMSIAALAAIAREDVVRTAAGGLSHMTDVQRAAIALAQQTFDVGIFETESSEGMSLEEARINATSQPPLVIYSDTGQRDSAAGQAAGDVAANFLLANWTYDDVATGAAAEEAAAEILPEDYQVPYTAGRLIANQGEALNQLQVDAIRQTSGVLERAQRTGGLLAVLAVLSAVLALYLNRFRPEFWSKPRMVALLGVLIVLAAGAVRATVFFQSYSWYVLPAVAFGLMATVLFDARIGVLMSLSMAILTAVGTRDPGITVYALLATMAPIGFVSAVSSRRAFRNASVFAGLAAGVIAAATSWFFHVGPQDVQQTVVGTSVMWAFGVSLVAALVGLAALQFFESAFDITTTLALLDLTDRNHAALQLLQEKAFGSFNHSLMVGTLSDAAARAIGADPLLARASAYYHDIGKTEQPTMFIENQFGIANPHDQLTAEESADVIRRHVTDGITLAKRFDIPSEVAEAIVSHHGDAIMRFFYEKARQHDPDVDPSRFRHVGHKPRTAETAIVMLADSLEASCRAVFQNEEPTPEAIEKVVNRVIDEKVNDGQLSESPVTLAQLTLMRKAFLGSLIGHYHQRIAYPNFPGT
jgi:putative nucleotidyltransferase with HDIG domain